MPLKSIFFLFSSPCWKAKKIEVAVGARALLVSRDAGYVGRLLVLVRSFFGLPAHRENDKKKDIIITAEHEGDTKTTAKERSRFSSVSVTTPSQLRSVLAVICV